MMSDSFSSPKGNKSGRGGVPSEGATQSTVASTTAMERLSNWRFMHKPVQPSHHQEWQDSTIQRLNLAKALAQDAYSQMSSNAKAHSQSARRHNETSITVHKQLKTKISA